MKSSDESCCGRGGSIVKAMKAGMNDGATGRVSGRSSGSGGNQSEPGASKSFERKAMSAERKDQ